MPKFILAPTVPPTIDVDVQHLVVDPSLVVRHAVADDLVNELAEAVDALPPIDAFEVAGKLVVIDGHHRLAAHKKVGKATIQTRIHTGTLDDCLLLAVSANATHGLRRTNAEKRRAVEMLASSPGLLNHSDEWVARQCGVSRPFAAKVLSEITPAAKDVPRVKRGLDGRLTDVSHIGRTPRPAATGTKVRSEGNSVHPAPKAAPPVPELLPEPAQVAVRARSLPVIPPSGVAPPTRTILACLLELTSACEVIENHEASWRVALNAITAEARAQSSAMTDDLGDAASAVSAAATALGEIARLVAQARAVIANADRDLAAGTGE